MRENEKATISLYVESPDTQRLDRIICDVICYRGKLRDPRWVDLEPGNPSSLPGTSKLIALFPKKCLLRFVRCMLIHLR